MNIQLQTEQHGAIVSTYAEASKTDKISIGKDIARKCSNKENVCGRGRQVDIFTPNMTPC